MQQGALPFQYAEEKNSTGMTALAGLATYLDLFQVADLRGSVGRHVGLREGGQGWTDSQMVTSLILLNLAGGESVEDLRVLDKDGGLGRVLSRAETQGMRQRERRRSVPSPSAVFRYICLSSMTKRRRLSVSRTGRSYPLRQMHWVV